MSFRSWLSIFTVILLTIIIYLARHEIGDAWLLLERVNLWILLLIIPMQLIVYYASGETTFSYLRGKRSIDDLSPPTLARIALEANFVNHVLPSAGVSGISYLNWRFGGYGVKLARATMAQVVRFAANFATLISLLILSVIVTTLDGTINGWILLFSALLIALMLGALLGAIYVLTNKRRMTRASNWTYKIINGVVRLATLGRKPEAIGAYKIQTFFDEMHDDYVALVRDKRLLKKPFLWALLFNAGDAALFFITFLALGSFVNPAIILIAYGLASVAGFIFITPGGAGAYEAIMVAFLAIAGIAANVAIAGILLARVIILLFTIGLGYIFYQDALVRYGKDRKPTS